MVVVLLAGRFVVDAKLLFIFFAWFISPQLAELLIMFEDRVEPVFLRTPYNYDRDRASDESGLECCDPSRTHQSFAEECDINTIVRRFNLTGELPSDVRLPQYGDFTGIDSYHSAMIAVAQANEAFDSLPADIRSKFHNSPEEFVAFCLEEKNRDALREMGLAKESPAEANAGAPRPSEPVPVPSVTTGDAGSPAGSIGG